MKIRTVIGLISLSFLLSACGGRSVQPTTPQMSSNHPISNALMAQYQHWKGTPYRLGGTNRSGIDCSAFTQITYRDQFRADLPRTTLHQVEQGIPVRKHNIQPGDLVFFKTAVKQRHVGIYVDNGFFLHASTSKGVTLSRLDNPYWQKHYWTARRALDN